jgi:hypothetical protein
MAAGEATERHERTLDLPEFHVTRRDVVRVRAQTGGTWGWVYSQPNTTWVKRPPHKPLLRPPGRFRNLRLRLNASHLHGNDS